MDAICSQAALYIYDVKLHPTYILHNSWYERGIFVIIAPHPSLLSMHPIIELLRQYMICVAHNITRHDKRN